MSSSVEVSACNTACQLSVSVYYNPDEGEEFDDFEVFAFQQGGNYRMSHFAGSTRRSSRLSPTLNAAEAGDADDDDEPLHKCQWVAAFPKQTSALNAKDTLYIAFKGTTNAVDVLMDASFLDVVSRRGNRVHSGLFCGVQDELPELLNVINTATQWLHVKRIVFCGHSLGGGYAAVAAFEFSAERDSADPLEPWPEGVGIEVVTFGSPLVFRAATKREGFVHPKGVDRVRMTHFVHNFDLVPRFFILPPSALQALIEEAPKMMGGVIVQQLASMAMKATGMNSLKISSTFDKLRKGYEALGTFVFLQSLPVAYESSTTSPFEVKSKVPTLSNLLQAHCSVVHPPVPGKIDNSTARSLLQYFPSIDPFSPTAKLVREEARAVFALKSLDDHGVFKYAAALRSLCSRPIQFAKAMMHAPRSHGDPTRVLNEPLSGFSMTPSIPPSAVPPKFPSTPWCLVSRVPGSCFANRAESIGSSGASSDLTIEVMPKGSAIAHWKAALSPLGSVMLQGLKQQGDMLRVVDAMGNRIAETTVQGRNPHGNPHLALERSGVLGYLLWECTTEQVFAQNGSSNKLLSAFANKFSAPQCYLEKDLRALYPASPLSDAYALLLHKLCFFTSGYADSSWEIYDIFGTCGTPEDRWEKSDTASSCRGCQASTFSGIPGKGKKRGWCHRCGMCFCPPCLAHHTWYLQQHNNVNAPICQKCVAAIARVEDEVIVKSRSARLYANMLALARSVMNRECRLSPADFRRVASFFEGAGGDSAVKNESAAPKAGSMFLCQKR
ncbi:hypothetical protein DIPPA_07578 [Diplonema papillatum]|nr:hypothetical protein DIPPA_07578 [Diplonema papillatum]